MNSPVAVLISDIHFNVNNLEDSSYALCDALDTAERLKVPLIIAGDLHDTKAVIRAECANRLIRILSQASTPVLILVGNHDKVNERGKEHSLNFLATYAEIVRTPLQWRSGPTGSIYLLPYQSDIEDFMCYVKDYVHKGDTIIMHQGVQGAYMGDYVIDKTSIHPDKLKDFKVISGHYHRHQTVGTVTYIGSPFTMSFGEANDGPKGYLVLNQDGSFERVMLDSMRKHIIIETDFKNIESSFKASNNPADKVWLKVSGTYEELGKLGSMKFPINFRVDKIYTDAKVAKTKVESQTAGETLDQLIDLTNETAEQKTYLKYLWKELTA